MHRDKEDEEYLRGDVSDAEVLENVLDIWKTSTKKDEESIHEEFVKKNEGMRENFEKDKQNVSNNGPTQGTTTPEPETNPDDIDAVTDDASNTNVDNNRTNASNSNNHNNNNGSSSSSSSSSSRNASTASLPEPPPAWLGQRP